jgi:hypothetical protein
MCLAHGQTTAPPPDFPAAAIAAQYAAWLVDPLEALLTLAGAHDCCLQYNTSSMSTVSGVQRSRAPGYLLKQLVLTLKQALAWDLHVLSCRQHHYVRFSPRC